MCYESKIVDEKDSKKRNKIHRGKTGHMKQRQTGIAWGVMDHAGNAKPVRIDVLYKGHILKAIDEGDRAAGEAEKELAAAAKIAAEELAAAAIGTRAARVGYARCA